MRQDDPLQCRRFWLLVCFNRWSWRWLERRSTCLQTCNTGSFFIHTDCLSCTVSRANLIRPEQTVEEKCGHDWFSNQSFGQSRISGFSRSGLYVQPSRKTKNCNNRNNGVTVTPTNELHSHIGFYYHPQHIVQKKKINSRWWVHKKPKLTHLSNESNHSIFQEENFGGIGDRDRRRPLRALMAWWRMARFCLRWWTSMRQLIIFVWLLFFQYSKNSLFLEIFATETTNSTRTLPSGEMSTPARLPSVTRMAHVSVLPSLPFSSL